MIKLIVFDLDGVLVETKKIHYEALNKALGEWAISWEDHLAVFDGLKTEQKLDILSRDKNLPKESHKRVWLDKQKATLELLESIVPNPNISYTISRLVAEGYQIACCSNCIRKSVLTILAKLGIIQYMDLILSNEDVKNSKPHPEIYWRAMSTMGCLPEETLVIEDSPYGLLAASRSKSNIMRVASPKEVTYENIKRAIGMQSTINVPKWKDEKLNILIPMAGAGSRFEKAGYTFPKPLIDVRGKPMIQVVVENLNIDANYIFVVQKSHREKYNLDTLLNLICPKCTIIEIDGVTEGAACTALLAKSHIDNENPLFFANSDQFVEWNSNEFMYKMNETWADAGMVTFKSTHPKWSFAEVVNGCVVRVAEKNPISDIATTGFYWWKRGADFVKYAEGMIKQNIRVNGEFYVCPVFNEAIGDQKIVRTFDVERMWGLGTPEDLNEYLRNT